MTPLVPVRYERSLSRAALATLILLASLANLSRVGAEAPDASHDATAPTSNSAKRDPRRDARDQHWAKAQELNDAEKFAEAAAEAEAMYEFDRQTLAESDPQLAGDLGWLADAYEHAEDWQHMEDRRRAALDWRRSHQGESHWETVDERVALERELKIAQMTASQRKRLAEAWEANSQAVEFWRQGDYSKANAKSQEATQAMGQLLGTDRSEYGTCLHTAAVIARASGKLSDAKPLYLRALDIYERSLGERHPFVATEYDSLGSLCSDLADFGEAERLYRQALRLKKELFGENDHNFLISLNNLGLCLLDKGDYAGAEAMLVEAAKIQLDLTGADSSEYGVSLGSLGGLYTQKGDMARAEASFREALSIHEKSKKSRPLEYASSLGNLATLLCDQGKYSESEPLQLECLELRKQVLGDRDPQVALSHNNIGTLHEAMGRFPEAEQHYRTCLAIKRSVYGEAHPEYALALSNLAGLLRTEDKLYEAEKMFRQVLVIREEAFGEKHPDYAASLNNLAGVLCDLGECQSALPLYERSLNIRREALGEGHPAYGDALNNLADVYRQIGDFAKAEILFRQALDVCSKTAGTKHPDYATTLGNLGVLYSDMKDDQRAVAVYSMAIDVRRAALGEAHPDYALSLSNLAQSLTAVGKINEARPLLQQAIEINRRVYGEDNPTYAMSLSHMGSFERDHGDTILAVSRLRTATDILRRHLGPTHPDVGYSLDELAMALDESGDNQEAERAYEASVAISATSLGIDHPDYATRLANLAVFYEKLGRHDLAAERLRECFDSREQFLKSQLCSYSEPQMRSVLQSMEGELYVALSMQSDALDAEEELNWVLRRKARIFDALYQKRRLQEEATRNPKVARTVDELRTAESELLRLNMQSSPVSGDNDQDAARRGLSEKIESLALDLRRSIATTDESPLELAPTSAEVRGRLPQRAALVDFVRYQPFNFAYSRSHPVAAPIHYAGFVCTGDPSRPVRRVQLGPAAPIDALAGELASRMAQTPRELAGGVGEQELDDEFRAMSGRLSALVWAPLSSELGDATTIYVAPDGPLHQIPFEALVDGENRYLAEGGREFAYLTSGRDLLRQRFDGGSGAVVFAAPDYDVPYEQRLVLAREEAGKYAGALLAKSAPGAVEVGTSHPAENTYAVRGLSWRDLPGARDEGAELVDQLAKAKWSPVASYLGERATEDSFKHVFGAPNKPKLLSVITHGYFLADAPAASPYDGTRGGFAAMQRLSRLRKQDDPLLRSGLVLAGANQLDEKGDVGDGWLSAGEIANLDLRGTDLVVLSACNSGSGKVESGQAVAGLRSAILLAGANTIIGSLFPAPDRETRELMHDFYENLFAGQSKLDSLQNAREAMIARRKQANGAAHPFFWSGFVLVGRP